MTAEDVIAAYKKAGLTIATAESCTAGMIAAALTDIAGSSAVFERGFVTYSNAAKTQMLDVDPKLFDLVGAVSVEVAEAMVRGALKNSSVDVAVSVTGIAGPGGSEFKPEGRVCFGIMRRNGKAKTEQIDFGALGRANVRTASVDHALGLLVSALP